MEEQIIAKDEHGNKLISYGIVEFNGEDVPVVKLMAPDGSVNDGDPVPLPRFLKFSCNSNWVPIT